MSLPATLNNTTSGSSVAYPSNISISQPELTPLLRPLSSVHSNIPTLPSPLGGLTPITPNMSMSPMINSFSSSQASGSSERLLSSPADPSASPSHMLPPSNELDGDQLELERKGLARTQERLRTLLQQVPTASSSTSPNIPSTSPNEVPTSFHPAQASATLAAAIGPNVEEFEHFELAPPTHPDGPDEPYIQNDRDFHTAFVSSSSDVNPCHPSLRTPDVLLDPSTPSLNGRTLTTQLSPTEEHKLEHSQESLQSQSRHRRRVSTDEFQPVEGVHTLHPIDDLPIVRPSQPPKCSIINSSKSLPASPMTSSRWINYPNKLSHHPTPHPPSHPPQSHSLQPNSVAVTPSSRLLHFHGGHNELDSSYPLHSNDGTRSDHHWNDSRPASETAQLAQTSSTTARSMDRRRTSSPELGVSTNEKLWNSNGQTSHLSTDPSVGKRSSNSSDESGPHPLPQHTINVRDDKRSTDLSHSRRQSLSQVNPKDLPSTALISPSNVPYPHRWCPAFVRKKCGFAFWFSLLTCILISASILLILFLSRQSTYSLVHTLSTDVRSLLFANVGMQVNSQFSNALESLRALHYNLQLLFPNFANRTTVTDVPGYLTPILLEGAVNPMLVALAYRNDNGLFVGVSKLRANCTTFAAATGLIVSITPPVSNATYFNNYIPSPLHEPLMTRYQEVVSWTSDLAYDEPPSSIAQYLGPPLSTTDMTLSEPIYTDASRHLRSAGVIRSWSVPRTHIFHDPRTNDPPVTIATVRTFARLEHPSIGVDAPKRAPLAIVEMDLRTFGPIFNKIGLGERGSAFLFSTNGRIVASTDSTFDNPFLDQTNLDGIASRVRDMMYECGLITTRTDYNDFNVTSVLARYGAPGCVKSFEGYLFQAALLSQPLTGLAWSYAIVTRDEDFFGDQFTKSTITIAWVAAIILGVAILLTIVIAKLLSHPIELIVDSMERLIHTITIEAPNERKAAMSELQHEWEELVQTKEEREMKAKTLTALTGTVTTHKVKHKPKKKIGVFHTFSFNRIHCFTREVDSMKLAYTSFLTTLCSFDQLTAVNDAKKRFIRYIFHEVRVPFNAMVLAIEQLHHDVNPFIQYMPDAVDTLKILTEQADMITHILNDVLSLQKIEDNALVLNKICFDMERMIRACLYTFKNTCQEKSIKLKIQLANLNRLMYRKIDERIQPLLKGRDKTEIDRSLQFGVFGDMHRIRQTLSNFFSNACKFSPSNSTIEVRLSIDEIELSSKLLNRLISDVSVDITNCRAGRAMIKVTVTDEGIGIPKSNFPNLFKPYMQIDAGRLQKSNAGSGLGLSLVKSIIEMHNGTVDVESTEGVGSSFSFTIPMKIYVLSEADRRMSRTVMGSPNTAILPRTDSPQFMFGSPPNKHSPRQGTPVNNQQPHSIRPHITITSLDHTNSRNRRHSVGGFTPIASANTPTTATSSIIPADSNLVIQHPPPLPPSATLSHILSSPTLVTEIGPTSSSSTAELSHLVIHPNPRSVVTLLDGFTPKGSPPAESINTPIPPSSVIDTPSNNGSTSTPIMLPPSMLQVRNISSTSVSSASSTPAEMTNLPLTALRALVVEDSQPNRKLLCMLLKRLNCIVLQAADGSQCLDHFSYLFSGPPIPSSQVDALSPVDVILMDHSMPVMDGATATRRLREKGLTIPIIGVTGNALEEDINIFIQAGANEILTKPISLPKLERVFKDYCPNKFH